MKVIWKFNLDFKDEVTLEMPKDAIVLQYGNQGEFPVLWAIVESENKKETRTFRLIGTGHPMPGETNLKFINTSMFHNGALVFHLFEDLGRRGK